MPLPILPTAPSRDDPINFAARADALLATLAPWTDAANALEQSLQLVATTGTSTTSTTIGTGPVTITASTGKAWVVGAFVYLVSAASIANRMLGQITAYDDTTGALTVDVSATAGAGTFASWIIGLATATANASDVAVADASGYFSASSVETVLAEIFDAVRSAAWLSADAAGTANAITASFTPAVTTLTHHQIVYVRATAANTGSATFQADATAAKSIYKGANKDLLPGDIGGAGHMLALRRDQTLDKWELLNPARGIADSCPPGSIMDFGGETPPAGWLECDGSSLLIASYPELYAAIGTLHGSADALHFNIPDHRGRFKRGWSHGTGNDTGAATRTAAATGGATGDHVGTRQGAYAGYNTFQFGQDDGDNVSGSMQSISNMWVNGTQVANNGTGGPINVPTNPGDTRPINAAVMSIIKY